MPESKCCGNCAFFAEGAAVDVGAAKQGRCRRYPPQVTGINITPPQQESPIIGQGNAVALQQLRVYPHTDYPVVIANDIGCGEFSDVRGECCDG